MRKKGSAREEDEEHEGHKRLEVLTQSLAFLLAAALWYRAGGRLCGGSRTSWILCLSLATLCPNYFILFFSFFCCVVRPYVDGYDAGKAPPCACGG